MWKTLTVAVLASLAVLCPAGVSAVSLELAGTLGLPLDVPGQDRENSVGGGAAVIFGPVAPAGVALGFAVNKYDNEGDDGSLTFTTLYLDFRIPFVRSRGFGVFGIIAPELVGVKTSYSEASQASNPLVPASDASTRLGLGLGTGISARIAGDWLSLVSTQKLHFIATEVEGTMLFVLSVGIVLSN